MNSKQQSSINSQSFENQINSLINDRHGSENGVEFDDESLKEDKSEVAFSNTKAKSLSLSISGLGLGERSSTSDLYSECSRSLLESHERAIVDTVMRDIVKKELGVSFDDIASLAEAKRLLNEAVVLPLIMPEFFTGIREPWKVYNISKYCAAIL